MNQGSKEKPARIELRVTAKEKDKIKSKARKSGLLPRNTTARTERPMPCLQDWSTARIAGNACGLSPNPTAGLTANRDSSMFVPATV